MALTIGIFCALAVNFLYLLYRYIFAAVRVQQVIVSTNLLYIIPSMIIPALWWVYSTKSDAWNFYNRKNATLRFVIINDLMVMGQAVWTLIFDVLVFRICTIPVKRNIDKGMILNLCRIALVGGTFLLMYALYALAERILTTEEMAEKVNTFRFQHIFDTRENKENLYDLTIMKKLDNGAEVTFKENDRFVHMFVLGNSGTGKTSSTFIPSIICDLDKKMTNKLKRLDLIKKMIEQNRAYITAPEPGDDITEYNARAYEGYEKELKNIRKRYPDCGMTIMAPNNAMMLDVIRLASARGEKVNTIDPANIYTEENVRMLGLNPFFVPLGLDPSERQIQISNKAQTFAEVLMAVSEINGTGDQYFRDINTSVTTNIAIMCMLRANLNGTQTDITEIQACINDFYKMQVIVDDIQKKLHMKVVIHEISAKKKTERQDASTQVSEATDDMMFEDITDIRYVPQRYIDAGMSTVEYSEMLKAEAQSYYMPIHFVLYELLGPGYEKMFDQARGLRNLINKLLLDPRIKKVLSAPEESFINWDKALANSEITLINTALEFGPQGSTALGLFILLDMKFAIARRPLNMRPNHFLTIDEASQYMHPIFEDFFALFRQYRVACTIAMQSLSQMEKTPTTKYLKGVILGAGIHVVFGRINDSEMKIYEAMAGMHNQEVVQEQISSNSEFDENYSVTKGRRVTSQQTNVLDGFKIRQRDFQEVSVFMIDNGRVMDGFGAKVSFPKPSDYRDRQVKYIDFSKYGTISAKKEWELRAKGQKEQGRDVIREYETGIVNNEILNTEQFETTLPPVNNDNDTRKRPIPYAGEDDRRSRMGVAERYMAQINNTEVFDTISMNSPEPDTDKKESRAEEFAQKGNPDRKKAKIIPIEPAFKEDRTDTPVTDPDELDIDFGSMLNNDTHEKAYDSDLEEEDIDDVEERLNNEERRDI